MKQQISFFCDLHISANQPMSNFSVYILGMHLHTTRQIYLLTP